MLKNWRKIGVATKYTDAEAKAAAVQAGAITNAVTKAPTHDAVYDVKVTADAALPAASKYTNTEAVAAVEAAGLDLAANKGIDLEETLATDHTYSGMTCAGVAGEELVFGKLIYLDDTNHRWWKCQADDEDTHGAKRLLGMMITDDTIAAAGAILVLLLGFITDTGFSLSDFGAPIFISAATAGAITETAPTGTTGFIVRIIGHTHDDANTFFFNPDATYVELA